MDARYTYVPCNNCIWNNRPHCGRAFCMLPHCVGENGLLPPDEKPWKVEQGHSKAGIDFARGPDNTAIVTVKGGDTP